MIQISEESHSLLKDWCETNDKKMSKVIERWISEKIITTNSDTKNILFVQNR